MTQDLTELEQFIIWFAQLEEVPLKTRTDFLGHVLRVGGIDKKAQKFIDETLDKLEKKNSKKAEALKFKINLINSALKTQKNSKTSLKEKIVKNVTSWMNNKIENFKSWFKFEESKALKVEENLEKTSDISEVEKLKAGLM